MINANELRLGNWFITSSNKLEKVKTIDTSCMPLINSWLTEAQGYPIPLTPKILEALEFAGRPFLNDYYKKLNSEGDILIWTPNTTKVCASNQWPSTLRHAVYVHQLQNLYFSLTGEELNFNLKAFGTADSGT